MRPECAVAASPWRLAVPRRALAGRIGDRLGRGTGSSIEFEDWRDYQPGDDLRHVDWRGFARTDQLKVRLYREEVAPVLDIVMDTSRSMGSSERKLQAARDLGGAVRSWGNLDGGSVRIVAAGGSREIDLERDPFDMQGEALLPRLPLRGLRFVVSDFMWPGDPGADIRRLAAQASHLWVVQLLDPDEADPPASGACTLVDVESGERVDITLDAAAIAEYRERLARHTAAIAEAVRRVGGTFVTVVADEPEAMFRGELLRQGVLEPA